MADGMCQERGLFCVTIRAGDTAGAFERMAEAGKAADVIELRLDLMESFDIPLLVSASPKPVLATYRSRLEGGMGEADPETVCNYLCDAARAGAAFVDIELNLPSEIKEEILSIKGGPRFIISRHFPGGTPEDEALKVTAEEAAAAGAHIIKIVTRAVSWEDNFRVLALMHSAVGLSIPIIAFCMGKLGAFSRIGAHLMGSPLTFASLRPGEECAEGQMEIGRIKEILRLLGYADR